MPTLILTPRFTEDSIQLWRAAGYLGWDVLRPLSFSPPEEWKTLDISEPVLYVEGLFSQMYAEFFGITLEEPPSDWLSKLPRYFTLRNIRMEPIEEARRCRIPAFIKPPNDKSFEAKVYSEGKELPDWITSPVIISEPVKWEVEYRFWILDRKIMTFSIYMKDHVLQKDNNYVSDDLEDVQAIDFVTEVLDSGIFLPSAIVMDVGRIKERGWAIIEINAAWASGIYGSEPSQVLPVIQRCSQ